MQNWKERDGRFSLSRPFHKTIQNVADRISLEASIAGRVYIEWASALCRRPPLCGGGRAGSVNKTTGEVKTFKTYTKQTGGSSS